MMRTLGKAGFSQSYTYFTWKSSRFELTEYVSELAGSGEQEYFRPNFFVNTPDILTEELQVGGPAKFASRLVLAATLSPSYGIYSGFEHFEHEPVAPGSEEYLDSEKYELRERDLDGPLCRSIAGSTRSGAPIRRCASSRTSASSRRRTTRSSRTPSARATTWSSRCVPRSGRRPGRGRASCRPSWACRRPSPSATSCVSGSRFHWRLGRNFVRLAPGQAHVLGVEA